MGWGASIEVAREARAAQTDLQHGDATGATTHAQRAVNAAPQNPDLWFTLAYAARLSGQYSLSVEAYRRGLALKPSSVEGLSGLAQTYARMGRTAEAQQALKEVLAANPKSAVDLQLAGELLLTTDPKQAVDFLQRSDAVNASARTQLLLARAYERTGDGESAHKMLERARHSAPDNPEVLRSVASYYRDTGQYAEAVRILEDLHAKDAGTLAELGYSYALAGNTHAAARSYGAAASRAPQDIEIQLDPRKPCSILGRWTKAKPLLTPGHNAESRALSRVCLAGKARRSRASERGMQFRNTRLRCSISAQGGEGCAASNLVACGSCPGLSRCWKHGERRAGHERRGERHQHHRCNRP